VSEAVRSAYAQRVATVMVVVLTAAMCASTLLTVGRSAAAERQVAATLEDAGSRRLVVTDARSSGFITPSMVDMIAGLATVERAVGISTPTDVTNARIGPGGTKVVERQVIGPMHDAVRLVDGRWPREGEALVSAAVLGRLGMDEPVGAVARADGTTFAVVGTFEPRAPFEDLGDGVVVLAAPGEAAHSIDVLIRSSTAATATERAVLATLGRPDRADLNVTSPASLAEVQHAVMGDLSAFGRRLMLLVLGVGGLLVAVVALSDVLLRRRELGRRRALGAPRWVLISLVVGRTAVAAVVGAAGGTGIGVVVTANLGQSVPVTFALGTAILAVVVATVATVPPAVTAANRDPVRVLRTP